MNASKSLNSDDTNQKDGRGLKDGPLKIDPNSKRRIQEHITFFARVPSHCCRKDGSKEYFQQDLNLKQMYRVYVTWCHEMEITAVKEYYYRNVFYTDFNLALYTPKKDSCSTCAQYENSSKGEQIVMKEQQDNHMRNTNAVRALKEHD